MSKEFWFESNKLTQSVYKRISLLQADQIQEVDCKTKCIVGLAHDTVAQHNQIICIKGTMGQMWKNSEKVFIETWLTQDCYDLMQLHI